jgi:hypothetical protein
MEPESTNDLIIIIAKAKFMIGLGLSGAIQKQLEEL